MKKNSDKHRNGLRTKAKGMLMPEMLRDDAEVRKAVTQTVGRQKIPTLDESESQSGSIYESWS